MIDPMILPRLMRSPEAARYLSVSVAGNLLADEEKMGDFKCEGIEFA